MALKQGLSSIHLAGIVIGSGICPPLFKVDTPNLESRYRDQDGIRSFMLDDDACVAGTRPRGCVRKPKKSIPRYLTSKSLLQVSGAIIVAFYTEFGFEGLLD